jgi:hypothetical protein
MDPRHSPSREYFREQADKLFAKPFDSSGENAKESDSPPV